MADHEEITVSANEREFQTQVISWLNSYINNGSYPFEQVSGEASIRSSSGNTLFPDVWLWLNREAMQAFCMLELKPTSVRADDQDLIDNAIKKSKRMKTKYFVTWNMQDAVLWEILDPNTSKVQRLHSYDRQPIDSVEDLKAPIKRLLLEERARDILLDLSKMQRDGHFTYLGADDWFFIHKLTNTSNYLYPFYKAKLLEMIGADAEFRVELFQWAVKQGFVIGDDQNTFLETVAKQIVYQLLGRLLFLQVLRRFRSDLRPLNIQGLDSKRANEEIHAIFAEIRDIDYQAVFERDLPDRIEVPSGALPSLVELLNDFDRRDFSNLPQEVLGSVFENLIPPEERHRLGQYFTNEYLVDFITAFCIQTSDDVVLDPTCGTGTFLIRAYDKFRWSYAKRDHQALLNQIWGIDIAPFPAELATLNMYRQNIADVGNFPRVLKKDFFNIALGQSYDFPPNKPLADAPTGKISQELPEFDVIIGNPPYIRQENIDKAVAEYSATVIDPALQRDKQKLNYDKIELSGQADIYAAMFVHAAALLKEGGRIGFVTSNSWLGSEYGKQLQAFFLRQFKIIAIVESRVEPWFETAQVNTIFTILEKCSDQNERDNHLVKFIGVKKKLKDLLRWDMRSQASERWHNLTILVEHVIGGAGKQFSELNDGKISTHVPHLLHDFDNSDFRIRVTKQEYLADELSRKFGSGQWGRYLRAPKIYFDLRMALEGKLVNLSNKDVAEAQYGLKPGIVDFFKVSSDKAQEFGIEPEFLAPLITSMKEIETPVLTGETKYKLFKCHLSKSELLAMGKSGALKYIEWGESQKTSGRGAVGRAGIPWPQVSSVKGRKRWYDVGSRTSGQVLINQFIGERLFYPVNKSKSIPSNAFFDVSFNDPQLVELWTALMNSALFYLITEVHGRVTWSQGVLYLYGPEIDSLLIPDARKIDSNDAKNIIDAFQPILRGAINNIQDEIKKKERREFDALVLRALGLSDDYLVPIYDSLVDLVKTRLDLGKMQSVQKTTRKSQDTEAIKANVIREVLPQGLLHFPEDFVSPSTKFKPLAISPGRWHKGHHFLGQQEIVHESGKTLNLPSVEEAEYILLALRPDSHLVRIPVVYTDLIKALATYKEYIKRLREDLARELVMRTGDQSQSERLSAQLMEELGIVV